MLGKMSSKTTTRLQARVELCRTRVRATARRHSRRIVANNWLNDRESMFPQLHYVLLALILLTASSLSVKAQVNASEKSTSSATSSVADQPALPKRIPMIAADYVAPEKQPPSLERVGVNDGDALPLSLNEAIRLALENNNDIHASRIDVEMAEHDLTASRGAFDPKLFSESYFEHQSIPVASQLTFTYTQPLVRGLRTDDARRRIEIAKKNLTLTDVQFRQKATEIITNVEQAYWELVNALKTLQVQIEAVKQSRAQVETNKRQVAQGVLAPIDVVEAEAQVKNFEQYVYSAQEQVTRAENTLKTLMLPDRKADLWSRALLPTTPVALEAPRVLLSEAINAALENRMELAQLRTSAEINQIDQKFYRDQTKPQVDLELSYSSNGYAGSISDNTNPLITDMTALQNRIAELSSIAGLPPVQTHTLS